MTADVSTATQAEHLAAQILAPRERPLVLVSSDIDGTFFFDIERLRAELEEIADVVTIATGTVTKHLETHMPPKTQVFNGAARSYGPDFYADPDWALSHLRFPGQADTTDLINDAMSQLGRRTVESAPTPSIRRASGIVEALVAGGTRALVRLDDDSLVMATADLLPYDLPLGAILVLGEPVSGILNDTELQLEPATPDLSRFVDGSHTLALVTKITDLRATVQLHPRVAIVLRRRDVSADEGPVGETLHVGDVIRVRVRREPARELALSYVDADYDAPLVPALPLVVDGPPWLAEGRATVAEEVAQAVPDAAPQASPASAPTLPATGLATQHDIAMLSREISNLRGDLLALTNLVARTAGGATSPESLLTQLRDENELLRTRLAAERAERAQVELHLSALAQKNRETSKALRDADRGAAAPRISADEPSIRAEITRAWQERTADGDHAQWPLRTYSFGPAFLQSFAALDEPQQAKAIRATVDAITGRDREIPGRDVHRLRTGNGGDDPYRQRADGAKCWRSALEQNAPGARRLHYWELPNGSVELARLVHHDDMRA